MWVTATTSPLAYDCTETTGLRTALCWIRCRRIHRCSLIRDQTWWSPPGRRLAEIIKSLNDSLAHQSVFLFLTLRVWNKPSASRGSLIVYLLLARKCFPVVFPTWVFHYWKMCFLVEVGSESEALLLKMYILSFFFFPPSREDTTCFCSVLVVHLWARSCVILHYRFCVVRKMHSVSAVFNVIRRIKVWWVFFFKILLEITQHSFWPHMEQLQSGDVNTFRSTKCDVEQAVKRVSFPLRSRRFISRHPKHNIPQHKRRKTGIVWRSWLWQCGNHPPPRQSMRRITQSTC